MSIPKTPMTFTDNTGAEVETDVSDPATAEALESPSLGERALAPEAQLLGPAGDEDVDRLL